MSALTLTGVSHAYGGDRVVRDVSLSVARGAVSCLLGPSGCGKSTLLRLIAGLEDLQSGRIDLFGETVADDRGGVPPEARRVGMMFQDFALFPHLDVRANVCFGLAGLPAAEQRRRVEQALDRVGMSDAAASYPHMLSGGEQQRVALARALAPEPRVMLLDEPFSNLDIHLRDQVRRDCLAVLRDSGTTTLLVTHDPEEAMMIADRIAVMRAGSIVQEDVPEQLYRHPVDAFCAEFFGKINRLTGVSEGESVETALGPVTAEGWADGTVAQVLLRPEGVRVGTGTVVARVVEARPVGAFALVRLSVDGDDGAPPSEVVARLPGFDPPGVGSRVRVGLDPTMAFVFPASDR